MDWCDSELNSEFTPSRRILLTWDQKRQEECPKIDLYANEITRGKGNFLVDTGDKLSIIHNKKLKLDVKIN